MKGNHTQRIYLFDARRATPQYPRANRYCCSLLPELAKLLRDNEKIHVIASKESGLSKLKTSPGITQHRTHASPESLKGQRAVKKAVEELRPDIYHSATFYDFITAKINSIVTIHQYCPLSKGTGPNSLSRQIKYRLRIKTRLRRFNTFISTSRTLLSSYAEKKIENNSVIIPYGIGQQFKELPQEETDAFKEKHTLPKRFLLMIAADKSTRNLTTVLDALRSTDFTETAPLVIAGYGSQCDSVTKLIKQRNLTSRVYQLGPLNEKEMPPLYNAAFALLFPGTSAGTGLPVMEAMACGTPIICSSLPILAELTDGTATLAHPTCKVEWSRAINTALLSIDWPEESREAVLKRAKSFSWEQAAIETLKIYRR